MPRQNRALPTGEIAALPFRGLLMGNRGCLHDATGAIVRDWNYDMWIACVVHRTDRNTGAPVRRELMRPGFYTELFFLDEPAALAAGHRPCLECRRGDGRRFLELAGVDSPAALDRLLMAERRTGLPRQRRALRRPRLHPVTTSDVPVGAMVLVGSAVFARHERGWLALRGRIRTGTSPTSERSPMIVPRSAAPSWR